MYTVIEDPVEVMCIRKEKRPCIICFTPIDYKINRCNDINRFICIYDGVEAHAAHFKCYLRHKTKEDRKKNIYTRQYKHDILDGKW